MRYFVFFLLCSIKIVTFVSSRVVRNANISIQSQDNCVMDKMIIYNKFTMNNGATTNIESITHSQLMVKANNYFKTSITNFARDASTTTSIASTSTLASSSLGLLYPLLSWLGNFSVINSSPRMIDAFLSTYSTLARVITIIVGSQVLSQTFVVATLTNYSSLISIVIVITLDASNNLHSFTVGPGDIYWTLFDPPLSTSQVDLPFSYSAKSMIPSTRSTSVALNIVVNAS